MLTPLVVSPASLSIVSGNQQSATVGTALGDPLVIKVAAAGGVGIPGVIVNFAVNPPGAATVSPSPAITLNDGTGDRKCDAFGAAAGSLTITASANGVSTVSSAR